MPLAAATPRGLIVPEVRDADSLSLNELAVALTQLIDTAREGKTTLYMLNGTITISNVGVFGEIKVRKVLQLPEECISDSTRKCAVPSGAAHISATFVDRERRLKTLFPQGIRTDRHLFE